MLARAQLIDPVIALGFGAGLFIAPQLVLGVYGLRTDDAGWILARLVGALLLGYAGIKWATFRAEESALKRQIVRSEGVADVLGVIVTTVAAGGGVTNGLGWSLVELFAAVGAIRLSYTSVRTAAPATV